MHRGWRGCGRVLIGALLCGWGGVAAKAEAPGLDAEIRAEVGNLADRAATIFVGQIVGIHREAGTVEVRFRVEQTVRGATGPTVVLREWGGNWAPGQVRYVVGMRVLAFLHGRSAAGLSSPVHGAEGLVPVVVQGARAPRLLDIRRVAASVVRTPGTPLPAEGDGALPLDDVLGMIAAGRGAPARVGLPLRVRSTVDLLSGSGSVWNASTGGMRTVEGAPAPPVRGGGSDARR